MQHYFDVETACAYGVTEALLLNHFAYWIAHNQKAGTHFRDGRTWTYRTLRELEEVFPYFTESAIRRALKHLREEGVLLTARYNAAHYDRTLWYAFANPDAYLWDSAQIKEGENEDETAEEAEPIPVIREDIRTVIGTVRESTRARWQPPEKEAIRDYCIQRGSGIDPEAFCDYYAARGWSYGPGKPMKDWKAAVRSWERREKEHPEQKPARSAEEIYDDIFAGRV